MNIIHVEKVSFTEVSLVLEEKDSQSHNTATLLLVSNACFGLFSVLGNLLLSV